MEIAEILKMKQKMQWKKRVRLERFYREAPVKLRRADWNKRKMALEQ